MPALITTVSPVQKGIDLRKGPISRLGLLLLASLVVVTLALSGCGGDPSTTDVQALGSTGTEAGTGTGTGTDPGTGSDTGSGTGTDPGTGTGTGSAILTWSAPTTNVDGTPLTTLAGYKVYYGTTPGAYTSIVVGNVSSYQIAGLANGQTYYFTVTAYDTYGIESDFAPVVSKSIS